MTTNQKKPSDNESTSVTDTKQRVNDHESNSLTRKIDAGIFRESVKSDIHLQAPIPPQPKPPQPKE